MIRTGGGSDQFSINVNYPQTQKELKNRMALRIKDPQRTSSICHPKRQLIRAKGHKTPGF